MKLQAPNARYSAPVASGGRGAVSSAIKTAKTMGGSTEQALARRVKLQDALGKLQRVK